MNWPSRPLTLKLLAFWGALEMRMSGFKVKPLPFGRLGIWARVGKLRTDTLSPNPNAEYPLAMAAVRAPRFGSKPVLIVKEWSTPPKS
jgi:hypothetical protein